MSNLSRNITVLLNMRKYCVNVDKAFEEYDKDLDLFTSNSVFKDAVSMEVLQIGELVNCLTDDFINETKNDIDWHKIRAMRNRFAHDYQNMDVNVIYDTAINDIPKLEKFIDNEIYKYNKENGIDKNINNKDKG